MTSYPSVIIHISEQVVYELLEHSGRVADAEEYDNWFKESFVSIEGCLLLVAVFDTNDIVPPTDVKFGEVVSVFQLVHEIRDKEEGVGITDGVFIEILVVLAGAKFSIFLFNKERRCLGGIGGSDFPGG